MIDLPKNRREVVRIERTTFEGIDCINIRIWFRDNTGQLRPTKKGITVRAEMGADLALAISKVSWNGS